MFPRKRWKKNLRKIPEYIAARAESLGINDCVVGCLVRIDAQDIMGGIYSHLGLELVDDVLEFQSRVVPFSEIGTYSKRNREGFEIVYKDRPMTQKSWSVTTPNWGDWSYGSHDIIFTKDIYQREFIGPKLLEISIERIGEDIREQSFVFKFIVEEVLDRRATNFENALLFNLNLLQENTGNHGVFASDASIEEYLSTLYVNWEILPPGEHDENLLRIMSGVRTEDPQVRENIADRYDFLLSMEPLRLVRGTSGFRRYFGAQFAEDLVVFENIEYGNAIYVMYDNWERLSQMSRTDLLSSRIHEFDRIPHTKTWKLRLRKLILREMTKRAVQ